MNNNISFQPGSPWPGVTTTGSPWLTITPDITTINSPWLTITPNKYTLENLFYYIEFECDNKSLLNSSIVGIRRKKFIFNCNYVGNRIQPYEYIMNLIDDKKLFSVNVTVSDILTISYVNVRFTEIENNLNFNGNCNFSELKVRFRCEKILYKNHKLSNKELRADKIKKINENVE